MRQIFLEMMQYPNYVPPVNTCNKNQKVNRGSIVEQMLHETPMAHINFNRKRLYRQMFYKTLEA